jgi:hypothetical protein
MRCISFSSGGWVERLSGGISDEERRVLEDLSFKNEETRKSVIRAMNERSFRPAEPQDAEEAQKVYEMHMVEGSVLVAANVILPSRHGSISCKVGEDYKHVRF